MVDEKTALMFCWTNFFKASSYSLFGFPKGLAEQTKIIALPHVAFLPLYTSHHNLKISFLAFFHLHLSFPTWLTEGSLELVRRSDKPAPSFNFYGLWIAIGLVMCTVYHVYENYNFIKNIYRIEPVQNTLKLLSL